jgi:hypothetical protein
LRNKDLGAFKQVDNGGALPKDDLLLSPQMRSEIERLVQVSFELSLTHLFNHVLEYGPFITSYLNIRKYFLQFIEKGSVPSVDLVQIGNHRFLRLRQKLVEVDETDYGLRELLIPIGTNNSVVFLLSSKMSPDSLESKNIFKASFLNSAKWYFDYKRVAPFTAKSELLTPLVLVDSILDNEFKIENIEVESFLYHFYFDLSKRSLETHDVILKEILIASLNRYYMMAEYRNQNNLIFFSQDFFEHLKTLKGSLLSEDLNYFGIK